MSEINSSNPPLPPSRTGRTSCIGQHSLCLGSGGEILNDTSFKPLACADYVARSSKVRCGLCCVREAWGLI